MEHRTILGEMKATKILLDRCIELSDGDPPKEFEGRLMKILLAVSQLTVQILRAGAEIVDEHEEVPKERAAQATQTMISEILASAGVLILADVDIQKGRSTSSSAHSYSVN